MVENMAVFIPPFAVEAPKIQDPTGCSASPIGPHRTEATEENGKEASSHEGNAILKHHEVRLRPNREARKKIKSAGKREGKARNKGVEIRRRRLAWFKRKSDERERAKAARKAKGLPTRNRDRKRSSRPTELPTWKRQRKLVQMDLFGTTTGKTRRPQPGRAG